MAASSMSQSMASYYNPSAAYGSLSAASMAAAAAAAQQSAAAMSAGLTAPAQVSTTMNLLKVSNFILNIINCIANNKFKGILLILTTYII